MSTQMKLGAITLIDILGWKGIWQRDKNAVERLKKFIDDIRTAADKVKEQIEHFKELEIEILSISDTIAIITYCDTPNIALEFHGAMSAAITSGSIKRRIPVRGATAYGSLYCYENIMMGPAVDEVAEWYEATNWIGVILTPSAMFKINVEEFKKYVSCLKKYQVPMKQIGVFETYCCNWPENWKTKKNELMEVFSTMGSLAPTVAKKYENTLKFYDYCIQ